MKTFNFTAMTAVWMLTFPLHAASPVALVYENKEAVLQGRSSFATILPEGILVPAQLALSPSLLAAPLGEPLHRVVLVRLDNDLNLAFVRLSDEVSDPELQKANAALSAKVAAFVPAPAAAEPFKTAVATGPFLVKINGQDIDAGPVELRKFLKKSKFKLELVSLSTAPVWRIDIELKSSPKLGFWKEGRKTGLNDVPTQTFTYSHQIMFSPMKIGQSAGVPVEVFFIEGQDYEWTLRINLKNQSIDKKVRVRFL